MNWVWILLLGIASYTLGSLSPSVFISRRFGGFDIRKKGSGNAGTTNMLRTMGWKLGLLTFVADFAKGALPTLIGLWMGEALGVPYIPAFTAGGCALLGHAFPAYAKFRGGKCVASSAGVLMVLNPGLTAIVTISAILIMFITRRVSIGSIVAFVAYPVISFLTPQVHPLMPWFTAGVGVLVLIRHRENILRLYRKEEKPLIVASSPKIWKK